MPTYHCTTPPGELDAAGRQRMATAITVTHERVTGAPAVLAQVLFHEAAAGAHFVGGVPAAAPPVFVHGLIRAGRDAALRERLLAELVSAVASASGLPRERVWVYLGELPPAAMAEYGRPLPAPGEEAAWLAALPEAQNRDSGARD